MARRRSGNMGTAPASASPFVRAEVYMKYRDESQNKVLLRCISRLLFSCAAAGGRPSGWC